MFPEWIGRLRYYGLALLFVAAAALLRWALPGVLGPTPFLVFYLAWVGAAAFGGLGPGLFATLASWLCVEIWFDMIPGGSAFIHSTAPGRLAILLIGGLTVCLIAEKMRRGRIHERRQTEKLAAQAEELQTINERLRESEEKYRAVVENSLVGIGISKGERIVYANRSLLRMYGYDTFEEFAAKSLLEHLTPPSRLAVEEWGARWCRGEALPTILEHDIVRKDGTIRTLQLSFSFFSREDGVYAHTAFVDITERKRAEEALRQSERNYREVFNAVNDAIFVHDGDTGAVLDVNESMLQLYGGSRDEALRLTPDEASLGVSPYSAAEVRQWMTKTIAEGPQVFEWRARKKNGELFWVEVALKYAQINGQPRVLAIVRDISERKRTEEALRKALTQAEEGRGILEAMMEHIPMGIIIADAPDTKVRMVSRYGREMVERTGAELTDIPAAEHLPIVQLYRAGSVTPATAEELPLVRATQHGEWVKEEEWVVIRKDGVKIPVLCTAAPICDKEGHVTGGVLGWQDVTQRKQAEAQLQRLNEELERRVRQRTAELLQRTRQLQKLTLDMSEAEDRERRRIAGILHDDLQQVLAAAKFHVGLMRRQVKQDPSLQTAALEIDEMLKEAIHKSRSLSHELSPGVLHHGDLNEILQWLANQVQAKHGLAVHVHTHGEVRLQSDAVTALLYRTVQELLFNVVKHARAYQARVRVRQCAGCICLSVSDRGRGFDPQELRDTAGFGLLNIRERLELLGGRMKIRSARNKGSTFFVAVPTGETTAIDSGVEMKSSRRTRRAECAAGENGGRLRVLLADDHEIVRQGLTLLLGAEDTVEIVGTATNGREAVDLVDQLHPDVVIMDVSMPVMNGEEATRRIKMDLPQTRVISLSMWEEPEVRERMYRAGAESYVLKTASTDELLAAIQGKGSEL